MKKIELGPEGDACHILVGRGILRGTGKLLTDMGVSESCAVVTNPTVNGIYGGTLAESLEAAGIRGCILEMPDSETSKSLAEAERLCSTLSKMGLGRDACIVGLGGGVVGDMAGFVAATYLRGVVLAQVPTTLLAQADSAIGGKSAVNIAGGKNLVGAFHQPLAVISDVDVLHTLPERDFVSGLAEVAKYGIACDGRFFSWLGRNSSALGRRDAAALEAAVAKCSSIKAGIVRRDERDTGERLVLNFGHTLGHALEAAAGYGTLRHGEAVAIGMLFAARLSVDADLMAESELDRISALLRTFGLPEALPRGTDIDAVLGFMEADKKKARGKIRFVLPAAIGRVTVSDEIGRDQVRNTLGRMAA